MVTTKEGVRVTPILDQKEPCRACGGGAAPSTGSTAAPSKGGAAASSKGGAAAPAKRGKGSKGKNCSVSIPAVVLLEWDENGEHHALPLCFAHARTKNAEFRRLPIANLQPLVLQAPPGPQATPWPQAPPDHPASQAPPAAPPPSVAKRPDAPLVVLPPGLRPSKLDTARSAKPAGPAPIEVLSGVGAGSASSTTEARPREPVSEEVNVLTVRGAEIVSVDDEAALPGGGDTAVTEGDAVARHPAFVYLARLARGSRPTMKDALDTIAQIVAGPDANLVNLPWHGLRYNHTALIRSALVERYAPATANKMLSALRCVLREAWKLGQIDTDSFHRAVEIDDAKGARIPVGIALSRKQMDTLFRACARDTSPMGRRDAALLALLLGTGVRRAEAVGLALGDYDAESGQITVRRGKGNKDRRNWLNEEGRAAIAEWLAVRGRKGGPLLCPFDKYGRPRAGKPMSTESVYVRLKLLAERTGVTRFAPHDTRRTYITRALEDGEDLVTVQRLAGHERVETTARYDRRGDVSLRAAALRRFLPFHSAIPEAATSPAIANEADTVEERSEPKKRDRARTKAPRIASGASSRAKTTQGPRKPKTKRPDESRRKPGKTQRLQGRSGPIARHSARRKA